MTSLFPDHTHPTFTLPGDFTPSAPGDHPLVGHLFCPDFLGGEPVVVEAAVYDCDSHRTLFTCRYLEQVDADAHARAVQA
jgi:hypothetical protein